MNEHNKALELGGQLSKMCINGPTQIKHPFPPSLSQEMVSSSSILSNGTTDANMLPAEIVEIL